MTNRTPHFDNTTMLNWAISLDSLLSFITNFTKRTQMESRNHENAKQTQNIVFPIKYQRLLEKQTQFKPKIERSEIPTARRDKPKLGLHNHENTERTQLRPTITSGYIFTLFILCVQITTQSGLLRETNINANTFLKDFACISFSLGV
jgi:hypothetical protein